MYSMLCWITTTADCGRYRFLTYASWNCSTLLGCWSETLKSKKRQNTIITRLYNRFYENEFLCYSRSNPNQVVWHYAELGKVGEGVYTYLQQKDQYREEDDMIAIVLQLEDVFFEYGTYSRRFLADKDVAAAGAEVLKNFHRTIEQTMQEGRHLQLLLVRIYEELGLDAAPLIRYREERRLRLQREDEERKRRKEEQRRQVEEQQREQLRLAGTRFLAGEYISSENFIGLCKFKRIPIPLRTHGTLSRSVIELSRNSIRHRRTKGKANPKLDGCFAVVEALYEKLSETMDANIKNKMQTL